MKTAFASLLASLVFASACGDTGNADLPVDAKVNTPDAPASGDIVEVPAGDLTGPLTWEAKNTYVLKGQVFVTGGTLTLEAGTVIKGEAGSVLTITKGATLMAQGTADKPIVFTSAKTAPTSGDWGGVVLLGAAPINVTGNTNKVEGFPESVGAKIEYGGTNASHNCGTLKYARIEYAGFQLSADNELNGLTLGGCGNATTVDYVQVHLGLDDGIEIFGGTTNISHIVISQPDDDALDWDLGWTGKGQFIVVQQKTGRGDKAIEADSNKNNNDAMPRSAPELWNFTFIGGDGAVGDKQGGLHLRRGSAGKFSNFILAHFAGFAIDVDGAASVAQANTNALTFAHGYLQKASATALWPENFDVASGKQNDCDAMGANCFDEAVGIGGIATIKKDLDTKLAAPKNLTTPSWKPAADSPVLTGCGTPPAGLDQTATFCGAIGTVDWTAGWTKFPQ